MDLATFNPIAPATERERYLLEGLLKTNVFNAYSQETPLALENSEEYAVCVIGPISDTFEGGWNGGIFTAYITVERREFDFASIMEANWIPIQFCVAPSIDGSWEHLGIYWRLLPSLWTCGVEESGNWAVGRPRLYLPTTEEERSAPLRAAKKKEACDANH